MADWNGDGNADLFWRNEAIDPVTNQISNEIGIWLMDGKRIQDWFDLGSVRPEQGFTVGAIGDVDANGTTDILWRHTDGITKDRSRGFYDFSRSSGQTCL